MARAHTLVALGGVVFLTIATLAGMAVAQSGGPPAGIERGSAGPGETGTFFPGRRGGPFANPQRVIDRIFDRLDRNYDGVIDAAEFKSVIENRFDRIDRSKKGVITAADIKARGAGDRPGFGHGGRDHDAIIDRFIGRFMESFGKPADGQITKAEFVAAYLEVFNYVNRAGDGKVTRKEVEQYFNVARRMAPALRG